MSKAHFPHQRPSEATSLDAGRRAEPRPEYIPKAPAGDFIRPKEQAEPVRSALAELQSRLTRLPNADRGADVENTLRDLERRFAEIARRVEANASPRRDARSTPPADAIVSPPNAGAAESPRDRRSDDAAASPLLEAIAEIVRGQGPLDDSPESGALAPEPRFEALQRSIDSVARHLDNFREDAVERGDQQLVMMRQIENVRRELQEMAQAIGELAPRASVAAIEMAMGDLRQRIESQRDRGVSAETLAPAERLIGELRAVIEDLDPTPIVRNLRADVETIGIRLEKLQTGDVAHASAVRDLWRETHEIKKQLTVLAARPLPLEKIEARLIDVTQRIDGLALSRGPSGGDLGEVVTTIRSIVAVETGKGLETFNRQLESLARKLDLVAEQSAAARFDAIGERIDELGETLAQRIDQGTAASAPLQALIATLAQKMDAALDSPTSAFEEIGRRFDLLESRVVENAPAESLARIEAALAESTAERLFADLAQRIEQLRETIAARMENAADAGGAGQAAAIEALVRGLDRKLDAALAADGRELDMQAVERELAQLSFKIDRLDDPFAAPRSSDQNSRLDDISERLDRMHAAFAQRAEDGARVENRENELASLVQSLADRFAKSAEPSADDGGGLKSLETQIGALAQRLERIDAGNGGLIGLEAKINDLFARLDDTRSATTQAAEAAVRRAVADILREAASVQKGAADTERQREHTELRTMQNASSERTKETLTADDARERVVHRLSVFEEELSKIRSVARDVRGADADSPVAADVGDAESDEFAPVDPMEFLLPVGDGVADRRESPVASSVEEAEGLRSSVQWDFINAARRAADARTGEAVVNAGKAEQKALGGAVVELSAVLKERKRPLLLGVGALILLIGAYHFARLEMAGGAFAPVLKQQEAKAPAPAARPVGSREKPLSSKSVASSEVAQPRAGSAPMRTASPSAADVSGAGQSGLAPFAERPIAARRNIDPMPTGAIETAPLSSGDALAAIKRLALQGDPAAQYEMAARLVDGRGAARDPKAAARWFEKAAETGLAPAQYRLGSLYEKGIGVERDYARARLWYERAAESGNARAMHNFAVLLAEGGEGKPDYAAAAEWFRRAAEYGVRDSQFNLAILYARGLGVSRNLLESYAWFSAAADQGDADAAAKRDEIGARLDSKELAAARALAAAFRVKAPAPEANDAPSLKTGAGEQAPVKPATKAPSGKPKVSGL